MNDNSKVKDITKYIFKSSDKLLLDTNVWINIYCPEIVVSNKFLTRIYSSALDKIIKAKSQIFIDVLILSELINRYARHKWGLNKHYKYFKDYRNSNDFKITANEISNISKRILKISSKVESNFSELQISGLMDTYSKGNSDFNDLVLLDICKRNDFKLITEDGDFYGSDNTILTANKKLLSF